jgi:hypothetical protein
MRILKQCQQKDSITAQWIEQHAHFIQHNNPPHWIPLPQATEYLRVYMQEKAYIGDQANNEPNNKYKKRVYDIIHSAEFIKTRHCLYECRRNTRKKLAEHMEQH